jgi:hypothetical protein
MTTFRLGRLTMDDPQSWRQAGDQVSASGFLIAANEPDLQAMRQQLIGYAVNPDEPVVPIVAANDDKVTGFYRVLSADVEVPPHGHAGHWFKWSADLERVSDYAAPLIESVLNAADPVRDNDHTLAGLPTGRPFHALPEEARNRTLQIGTSPEIDTSEGLVDIRSVRANDGSEVAAALVDGSELYTLDPASWYVGAARLELDYAGDGTFHQAVGRQIPNLATAGRWRLSNGLFRLTLEDPDELIFGAARWIADAWTSPLQWWASGSISGVGGIPTPTTMLAPHTLTVLRNGPDRVVVRLTCNFEASVDVPWTIDLTITRGMPWVELRHIRPPILGGGSHNPGLGVQTPTASSVLANPSGFTTLDDAGIKRTAADGDGLKFVMASVRDVEQFTTEGALRADPAIDTRTIAGAGVFMFGLVLDIGASTEGPERPEGAALHFLSGQAEAVRVVER